MGFDVIRGRNWDLSTNVARDMDGAVRLATVLCLLLVTTFCIWALDRGFDITDEAYYLLLAQHPESVNLYVSAQQWVSSLIWLLTGSLVTFRAAGMLLLVAGAGILSWGVSSALTRVELTLSTTAHRRHILFACSVTCALVYVETINFSPSYNLLASAGAYAATGLVLLAPGTRPLGRWALLALSGCALAVEFVSKPSAGAATFGLLALWICLLWPGWRTKVIGIVVLTAGVLLSVTLLLVSNTTFTAAQVDIRDGLALFSLVQTESVSARLLRYVNEYFERAVHAFEQNLLLLAAVVAYLITRRRLFFLLAIALVFYTLVRIDYRLGYTGHYEAHFVAQTELGMVLLVMILLVSFPAWRNSPRFIVLLAGLVLLPYTVGVGTGNSILTQIIATLAPWGAAVAAIATLHYDRRSDQVLVLAMVTVFIVSFSLQTVTGVVRAPYHLVQPLLLQQFPITVGNLGSVKVDAETHAFVVALERAAKRCSIVPGTPFLGLYNVPGVALVMQAIPPVTPWLNNLAQAEVVLRRMPPESVHASTLGILLDDKDQAPPLPTAFDSLETRFRYCGTSTFPLLIQQVQIWHPQPTAQPALSGTHKATP